MKIALAQLNYHIGNLELNSKKIIDCIKTAEQSNVDLIVFSELSVCGYSPLDMLEQKDFINKCYESLNKICSFTKNTAAIVGLPTINQNNRGKKLHNSAAFLYGGEIKKLLHKTLLPTYDVFDEYRYFEPNDIFEIIEFKNYKFAVTICEDLWDEQRTFGNFDREMLYKNSPLEILKKHKPDMVINISGSPYSYNQATHRQEILFKNAIKYSLPIIYVNQTGANTDLIFDGGSMVINSAGNTVLKCEYFEEDYKIINIDQLNELPPIKNINISPEKLRIENINKALVTGIKDYFYKSGFSKAVLGLSGGIDSAVCLALAVQALGPEKVDVLLMPTIYSSEHSISDSVEMAKRCNVKYHIINIEELRQKYIDNLSEIFANKQPDVTEENIQARIRGNILMAFSNKFGNIVLNTSNKSEAAVGYTTLYGDMNGALSVLGDLYKTDVYLLAEYINTKLDDIIPKNIITKPPSAELRPGQKDNDSLPEYNILDKILFAYIEQKKNAAEIEEITKYNKNIIDFVLKLVNTNEYKRYQSPPILRVSSKSFGFGRRMPIVAKFN
ncbi:MAG TPA: NAD+ synthase [Bacteroidales bacterium]|nr:NAD+ synthase [Bacteroidales bacterium]